MKLKSLWQNSLVALILLVGLVTISYAQNQYNLTVSVNPAPAAGTVTLDPPGGTYDAGTVVTLTATPIGSHTFNSWSGLGLGDTSNGNVASIMMNSNKTIFANFNPPATQYTLTVSAGPGVPGTVTLDPPGGTYNAGTAVTLTATPNAGYTFSSWSGLGTGDTSTGNVASILMNSDKTIIANFTQTTPQRYTLTTSVIPTWGGVVNLNPSGGIYDAGTVVTLTANPTPPTYTFSSWSGLGTGDTSTGNVASILMNSDKTIMANFTQTPSQQYTLTTSVNPPAAGTVTLSPPGGTYNADTVVTLTATPIGSHTFNSWTGLGTGDTSAGNAASILMNGNKTITANFNPPTRYTLTTYVIPPVAGTVTLNPPGGIYDAGTVVTLTASPMANYTFSNWSGLGAGDTSTGYLAFILMNNDKTITANFNPPATRYTLTTYVMPPATGTVTLNPSGGIYDAGTVVTLTASPTPPYLHL